ncbi:MAG: DUF4136 domain-containing protein [Acidobacteria bacterium]|nr:DUF4136 domain-containing protein [Acidobacteriota bacterium]
MIRTFFLVLGIASAGYGQKVQVEFDESIDFSKYKTYSLQAGQVRSTRPELDSTLVDKKIRNAVIARLSAKGMQEAETNADVVVGYRMGSKDRRETESVPAGRRGMRTKRVSYRVTDATLTITMRDPALKEVVWQAIATDTGRDASKLEEHINKDVEKAFKDYPPKKKK